MKRVVMTFATVDAIGKSDGGSLEVEFAVDQKSSPANSVSKLRFSLTPSSSASSPSSGSNPGECRLSSADSSQLAHLVEGILASNPVP